MGKNIIVRIPQGSSLSATMLISLARIFQHNFSIENYNELTNLECSFARRRDVLRDAFLFIVKVMPPSRGNLTEIRKYLNWCYEQNISAMPKTIQEYQANLSKYTTLLIDALMDYWSFPETSGQNTHPAVTLLNKAEQYVIMQRGRPDLATLSLLTTSKPNIFVLQWEQQLAPCSPETLLELQAIKLQQETPEWFRDLPEFEQRFLTVSLLEAKKVEEAVSFIPSRLRTIPALANFSSHHLILLTQEGRVLEHFLPRLRSSHIASRDLETRPSSVRESHARRNLNYILELAGNKPLLIQTLISPMLVNSYAPLSGIIPDPYLYKELSTAVDFLRDKEPTRQIYLTNHPLNAAKYLTMTMARDKECLKFLQDIEKSLSEEAISQQVKRLKFLEPEFIIPMIMNSLEFTYKNSAQKGYRELILFLANNPLAPSGLSLPRLKAVVNMAFIEAGIIVRTKTTWDSRLPAGLDKEEEMQHRLTSLFLQHHSQLSLWKGWQPVFANHYHLLSTFVNSKTILDFIKKICDLGQLNSQYRDLINSGLGTATLLDYHCRELWLSSLENLLMILLNGSSYGSCVSGKDHKPLEIMHTNAMLLFEFLYKKWPHINDVDGARVDLVNLVVFLYKTRHAHEHAGQNAPGAEGVKTAFNYWPADIVAAIGRQSGEKALEVDDLLATNNEVSRIGNISSSILVQYASCIIAAMRLSEGERNALLDSLKIIFGEGPYWAEKKAYSPTFLLQSLPSGISLIKKILHYSQRTSVETLADIYYAILQRPEAMYWRADETQNLYTGIMNLYKSENPGLLVQSTLSGWEELKQKIVSSSALNSPRALVV